MIINRKLISLIVFITIAFLYVLLNSDSTSLLFNTRQLDSNIFQYMGYAITEGKIPYTDYFDHKGLLLYFINALGYIINKNWGVMLLQGINLTITLIVWYKAIVNSNSRAMKFFIIATMLLCLYPCYTYGNLTEEWSLLFISYPLMIFFNAFSFKQHSKFSKVQLLLTGICVGVITMIRMNNSAPILGFILYAAYDAIKNKEYKYLGKAIFLVLMGWLIPIFVCMSYMIIIGGNKGISDMWFANLIFNLEYNKNNLVPINLEYLKFIYKVLLPLPFILISLKKNGKLATPLLLGYIISIIAIGKVQHFHYLIIFIPLILCTINIVEGKYRYLLLSMLVVLNFKTFYNQFSVNNFTLKGHNDEQIFAKLLSRIPENEKNKVWSFNGMFLLKEYRANNMLQSNRMLLPWQIDLSPELRETELNKLCLVKPKYVIYALYQQDWMNKQSENIGSKNDDLFLQSFYVKADSVILDDGIKVICYQKNIKKNNANTLVYK